MLSAIQATWSTTIGTVGGCGRGGAVRIITTGDAIILSGCSTPDPAPADGSGILAYEGTQSVYYLFSGPFIHRMTTQVGKYEERVITTNCAARQPVLRREPVLEPVRRCIA